MVKNNYKIRNSRKINTFPKTFFSIDLKKAIQTVCYEYMSGGDKELSASVYFQVDYQENSLRTNKNSKFGSQINVTE